MAKNDTFAATEDTVLNGSVAGNDTLSGDGGNTFALGTNAAHGTVVVNADGTFTVREVEKSTILIDDNGNSNGSDDGPGPDSHDDNSNDNSNDDSEEHEDEDGGENNNSGSGDD